MNEKNHIGSMLAERSAPSQRTFPKPEPKTELQGFRDEGVVLPARKYRLKITLLFSDLWAVILLGYYYMIQNIRANVNSGEFSWMSLKMIASYIVFGITFTALVIGVILKQTKSIRTRIARDNELRQDRNINVWLTTFDWTWLILFVPTIFITILCGVIGYLINWAIPDGTIALPLHRAMGGIVFGFLCINAAVVIFKLTPTRVLLFIISLMALCLILLLMGIDVFLHFFGTFKHLGIKVDPLGYILMGYVGFFFLRLIWIAGLFEYIVIVPNRLDIQRGLSESERGIQRKDFRISIDTEDVILRLFKVGRIIISFPQSDRLPLSYLTTQIDKKAKYAMDAASVISVGKKGQEHL